MKAAARAYWFAHPDRSVARTVAALKLQKFRCSLTSLKRWIKEWDGEVASIVPEFPEELLRPEPQPAARRQVYVPPEVAQILSPRVAAVLATGGLAEVEDVISRLARSLSGRVEDMTVDALVDPEVAKMMLAAIATLSNAVHTIAQTRALTAEAHKNFAEGDRALSEADLNRANAEKVRAETSVAESTARMNNARVINGGAGYEEDEAAAEALAALKGMISQ
jgi:hypothetical protein